MTTNKYIFLVCVFTSTAVYAANTIYGQNPAFNLVAGGSNVFYGIANSDGGGGGTNLGSIEGGAVYSWNPATNSYAGLVGDIPNPVGTPVVAGDGSFYVLSGSGWLNPNGALYHIVNGVATPVHVFTNTSGEGANPNFITMVPDGTIYGTTYNGGWSGYGTIFAYNPPNIIIHDGYFSSPQSFSGADGGYPQGLVYTKGYLYGVTQWGGANGVGALYKWDYINDGAITVLHSFSKNDDLNGPQTGLSLSNDGNTLMGTTGYNGNDWGGGTFSYNIPSNSYNIVWYGSYYQATPPVQAQDGTWYQSAVSIDDHWCILAFEDGDKNIIPTVVFTGPNSTNNQGVNYQYTPINGLAYNPADNSLIATQQWGGANNDGYISEFTPIGTASITGTDVYDFASQKNYITVTMSYNNIADNSTSTLWAMCLPSRLGTWTSASFFSSSDYLNLECHATDTSVVLGLGGSLPGSPPDPASAKYTYNVSDVNSVEHDYVALENTYAYVNFNYATGTKNVNFYKTDFSQTSNNEYIKINVAN
jgi:uncharacterized repeat protein (TIGR03803 family)